MLEIVALIYLWKTNGDNARMRGKKAIKYQFLTLALWFGMELIGVLLGFMITTAFLPEMYSIYGSYLFGIIGAVLGGVLSFKIAKSGPVTNDQKKECVQIPTQSNQVQNGYVLNAETKREDQLDVPATVYIREELGGYGGNKDSFYLNGNFIGSLYPGMECILKTSLVKNTITIGTPSVDPLDAKHSVRFIAANNGKIEIYASEGSMIPELFKNQK